MTSLDTYAAMLRIVDAAICDIQTESDRNGALKAIRRAYNYACKHNVVPRKEAKRSADHRRMVIAQWYPGQLPEDDTRDDDVDPDVYSLDQLAEKEYERYS